MARIGIDIPDELFDEIQKSDIKNDNTSVIWTLLNAVKNGVVILRDSEATLPKEEEDYLYNLLRQSELYDAFDTTKHTAEVIYSNLTGNSDFFDKKEDSSYYFDSKNIYDVKEKTEKNMPVFFEKYVKKGLKLQKEIEAIYNKDPKAFKKEYNADLEDAQIEMEFEYNRETNKLLLNIFPVESRVDVDGLFDIEIAFRPSFIDKIQKLFDEVEKIHSDEKLCDEMWEKRRKEMESREDR